MDPLALGWTAARDAQLPPGCTPARVARVDRGRLSVLDCLGERRAVPGQALYADEPTGPAVGDARAEERARVRSLSRALREMPEKVR